MEEEERETDGSSSRSSSGEEQQPGMDLLLAAVSLVKTHGQDVLRTYGCKVVMIKVREIARLRGPTLPKIILECFDYQNTT